LTFLPKAKGRDGSNRPVRRDLFSYYCGGSIIFLAHSNYNFLVECLVNNFAEINDQGAVVRGSETILSPGFRCAINLGKLQIVPGIAVPISRLKNDTRVGIFLYLSFEHPY
jgi:hypothetical protein